MAFRFPISRNLSAGSVIRLPFLFIFLFLFLSAGRVWGAPFIKGIEIKGNKRIEKAAIISHLKSQVGATYNLGVVQEDIRSIFGMGYFENIDADEDTDEGGGVILTFTLTEKPIISKIEFEGNDALDKDDFKDLVMVKQYEVLDQSKLNQTVEKITGKYEEKGYYLADVRYEAVYNEKSNDAVVKFKIQEHDKVVVKTINIIGAKVIPADELKSVMQTREGGTFSWITGGGSYREAVFERDVQGLGFYYGMHGYVRARFGKPEVTVSPDRKYIYISFFVEEGEQYFVGNVEFNGELLYTRQELKEDMKLVKGDVFNTDTLRRETLRYTEKYSDLGYAFANVVPVPAIHDDTKTVDVSFEVEKGERVFIGRISVSGNTKTKDKVIRRELQIHEGELFNGTRKRESRENVLRLGFFDGVEFHQVSSKADPHVVDIDIKVKERSTGQLVIGAGYASGDVGFTFQAQLSQNNFLGNGQVASLSAQVLTGQNFYTFNLGFQEPFLGYSFWSLGGDLYQLRRYLYAVGTIPTFEETKTGFDVKMGHPIFEFTNLFLTYKIENSFVPTGSIIDTSNISPDSINGISSGVMGQVVIDKRDDRLDPRDGYFGSISSEFAGIGGTRKYLKSRATAKFFHPLFWDVVFRMHVTGANISEVEGTQVPMNELFIQGGLFSLRGYDYLTIGPKRTLGAPQNLSAAANAANLSGQQFVYGGHNELLMNMELEFPIFREAKIRGVVFFDTGNAFDKLGENGVALYANVGWGVRWFTPIGPLRFEFGYPIVNSTTPRFYFTIGPPF